MIHTWLQGDQMGEFFTQCPSFWQAGRIERGVPYGGPTATRLCQSVKPLELEKQLSLLPSVPCTTLFNRVPRDLPPPS